MFVKEIVLYGIALAMDALGITISLGIRKNIKRELVYKYIIGASFFQFFFFFIGGLCGKGFVEHIATIPTLIGGAAIAIIGIMMIVDSLKKDEKDSDNKLCKRGVWIILGISVSIDALVIGFTILNNVNNTVIFLYGLLVGLITTLICIIGLYLCSFVKRINFICKYSDFIGGVILLIFGIKMIFFT